MTFPRAQSLAPWAAHKPAGPGVNRKGWHAVQQRVPVGKFSGSGFELELDTRDLEKLRPLVTRKQYQTVIRAGLTYAAKATPPAVAKGISGRYNITAKRVKADTRGPFLTGTGENLTAELYFARRPPTALSYGKPKQTSAGLSVPFFKGQKTSIRGGFTIVTRRGQRLPVKPDRSKTYGGDAGRKKPRRALKVIHGPSVGAIYRGQSRYGDQIRGEVDARIVEMFSKGVARRFDAMARGFAK